MGLFPWELTVISVLCFIAIPVVWDLIIFQVALVEIIQVDMDIGLITHGIFLHGYLVTLYQMIPSVASRLILMEYITLELTITIFIMAEWEEDLMDML
jgi:hypothetical protein